MMTTLKRWKSNSFFCVLLPSLFFATTVFANVPKVIRDAVASVAVSQDIFLAYTQLKSKLLPITQTDSAINMREKKEVNVFLADYATKCGVFDDAGRFYVEAFNIARALEEQDAKKYLIKAIRVFIIGGNIEEGYIAYGKLVSMREAKPSKYDKEAELYIQYLQIAEMISSSVQDIEPIIKKLKTYANDASFKEFKLSILLTLWFIANDIEAEKFILKEYPSSIEAMVIKGDAFILPSTFWYLLPKNSFTLNSSTFSEQTTREQVTASATISIPRAYQIGFFKVKEHAEKQQKNLRERGFDVEIKEEKRAKNTVYYAVFVLEREGGRTGLRLKDAGFESFPIFD